VTIVSLAGRVGLFALVKDRLKFVVIACLNYIEDVVAVTGHISGEVPNFLGDQVGALINIEFYRNFCQKSKKYAL
jgi:hypothetical protein